MKEFGRTPGCICNVLAVLSDGENSLRATLAAAVDLAERSNARLTLVKTCDQGRAYVWVAPFAVGAAYLPPEVESPDEACQVLSRLADGVPASIPVTMHVLPVGNPQGALLKLLDERHFGAVVAEEAQLWHWRRVRRRLRREQLHTILISPGPDPDGALVQASVTGPRDESDAAPVTARRSHARAGLWPWHARHLAGAGGEH